MCILCFRHTVLGVLPPKTAFLKHYLPPSVREAFAVYPLFQNSKITADMFLLLVGSTAYDLTDHRNALKAASHFAQKRSLRYFFAGIKNKSSFFQSRNIAVCSEFRHTHMPHNFRKAWRSAVIISCILNDKSGKSFFFVRSLFSL